jgi:hypothetical protein
MKFHWLMAFFAVVMNLGGIIDAREHLQHGFEIESIFTPTHGLLYAGWILGGVALAIQIIVRWRKGKSRNEWLPKGYFASALGFLVFGFGGGFDLFWHQIYGFEINLEAPISLGHTLLVIGASLMYSAVLFHGFHLRKKHPEKFTSSLNLLNLPTLLAMISLLSAVLWPTWFLDPLLVDFPSGGVIAEQIHAYRIFDYGTDLASAAGLAGMFLMTLVTMPFILVSLNRWRMPVGFVTLLVAGYTGLRAIVGNSYIYLPATIGAAILVDLIWAWIRKGGEERLSSPSGYRLIAFAMPVAQYWLYFAIIDKSIGALIWSPYLWTGATFIAGVLGLLMSFLLIKPTNQGVDSFLYRWKILDN